MQTRMLLEVPSHSPDLSLRHLRLRHLRLRHLRLRHLRLS
jgi:hypothetical protein